MHNFFTARFLVICLLCSLPFTANAEWTMIQTHDGGNMYIDFDSLTKSDDWVTVTTLNDYYVTGDNGEMSSTWTELHDCKNQRFKALAISYYKGKMATEDLINSYTLDAESLTWSEVVPYSVGALKANIICSR